MYQEEYKRWMAADLEDPDLKPELMKIEGSDDEIKERFARRRRACWRPTGSR